VKSEAQVLYDTMNEEMLDNARELVTKLETGEVDQVRGLIDNLTRLKESELFQELGKLTRTLHESLANFQLDSKISSLTEEDLPDAKTRLNHVITMTEDAANKTMDAIDAAEPLSEELRKSSADIHEAWKKFRTRELSVEEFRKMSKRLDEFFPEIEKSSETIHAKLNEILMAQDFQDLTGQIIRRVITLVTDVEDNLVQLIKLSGSKYNAEEGASGKEEGKSAKGFGPAVPGVEHGSTVESQDDVDELLSSLGF
jgi:chemotaxis protein CheZ